MRTRVYKKQFWFNEEENITLKNNSVNVGMNESDYIRSLVMGYTPREKPDDRFYEVMKLMRSISNNLNQISKKAHSLGFVDELAYKKEADNWKRFMKDVKKEFLLYEQKGSD